MRYLFIMNPGSKSGRSRKQFTKILGILEREKVEFDHVITQNLNEAYNLSKMGNNSGYDVIAAVGGDGTINKVLNGFYDAYGRRVSSAKMGVIYTGTSPDFCKSYEIPTDIEKAVKAILRGTTKKIQTGMITLAKSCMKEYEGKPVSDDPVFVTRYFACCANIGLGAALARRANSGIRGVLGDFTGTFIALLRTLIYYRPQDFTICCDGKTNTIRKVHNISIGRTFYIASGIKLKNALKYGDDSFYCLTVRNMRAWNLPGIIKNVYSGKQIITSEVISLDYIKLMDIYGNLQNPEVEFDGDPAGFLPCRISMAADDLEVICECSSVRHDTPEESIKELV